MLVLEQYYQHDTVQVHNGHDSSNVMMCSIPTISCLMLFSYPTIKFFPSAKIVLFVIA